MDAAEVETDATNAWSYRVYLARAASGWVDFLLSLRARCCPEGAARVRNGFGNAVNSVLLFCLGE